MVDAAAGLLRAAGPQSWDRQVSALAGDLRWTARSAPTLPVELVDAILASGRDELIIAMCDQEYGMTTELRERLVASGNAVVALLAPDRADCRWPLRDRRTVFAAARPDDPAWTGPGGTVGKMLAVTDVNLLRAAVVSPFPELVRHVLEHAGPELTRAERLRAEFCVSPGDPVPVAEAEGTTGAIEELRTRPDREQMAWRVDLDWERILIAHRTEPFGPEAAAAVAAHPDCPEHLVTALLATHPVAVAEVAWPTPRLIAAPLPPKAPPAAARHRAERAVRARMSGGALLRATPASAVLEAVRRGGVVLDELSWHVAYLLGTDVARWKSLRRRLKSHRGSTVDLLNGVATGATADGTPTTWPDARPLPDLNERRSVSGSRAAFLVLLDAASVAAHLVLFDHLDDRTIHDLLSRGRWRDQWVDAAVSSGNPALRRSLSCRRDLDGAVIDRLAACDDPEVNGQLFRCDNIPMNLRGRILSQRPFTPGRTEPVPLDPALREYLMSYSGGPGGSPYHSRDAIDCADHELQLHILRSRLIYGRTPQLRLVLDLWRRHGQPAVEKLVAATDGPATFKGRLLSARVIKRVRRLLVEPEPQAVQQLADEVMWGESVPAQLALLRNLTQARLRESHAWHWEAIGNERIAEPLPDWVLMALSHRPGCPPWFRSRFGSPLEIGLGRGTPLPELLPRLAGRDRSTTARLVCQGRIGWPDIFAYMHATDALNLLDSVQADMAEEGLEVLRSIVGPTVDGRPEAWVLAIQMLPGFQGSVSELLLTAAAAAG